MIDPGKFYNPWGEDNSIQRIFIHPEGFDVEERIRASIIALGQNRGLVMEVWSSRTAYYADAAIPVGTVEVYEARKYGGTPEYVGRLDRASDFYAPGMEWA